MVRSRRLRHFRRHRSERDTMRYLEPHSRFIPSQHQPALILAFAQDRDVPTSVLFRSTDLSTREMLDCPSLISAQQHLQLMANTVAYLQSPDTGFLLGQLALPGHFGALSQALMHAPHLKGALNLLVRYQSQLSPLLVPHLHPVRDQVMLYWTDAFGAPAQRSCLVEMSMSAVHAMCRWLGERPLDWTFCFNRPHPRSSEHHEVHLGRKLRFNCLVDGILIDADTLDTPWPRGSEIGMAVAMRALSGAAESPLSLLSVLYDHLLHHIQDPPSLDSTAHHFGISPATFKRQLARLGTHFQAELDQVRTHVTLQLFHGESCDNDHVAHYLGFHDAANFRRSFKRWTGLTPNSLRAVLSS